MSTAGRYGGQDTMEPTSHGEEERRQVTRIPVRDEAKRGERGRYGDFPLRKAACTVRRSAGSRPNALSLLSGSLLLLQAPTRLHRTG